MKASLGALVLLLAAGGAGAQVMGGGEYSLSQSAHELSGGSVSGGGYSLGFGVGGTPAALSSAGSAQLSAGFFGSAGGGLQPSLMQLSSVFGASRPQVAGVSMGVAVATPATFNFSKPMIPSLLAQSVSARIVRDRFGNAVSQSVPVTISYNGSQQAVITPTAGSWSSGAQYELVISTSALDFEGLPLPAAQTQRFATMASPAELNVLVSPADSNTRVMLSSNTFGVPFYLRFSEDPVSAPITASPSSIQRANSKAKGPLVLAREISPYDASDNLLATGFASGQVRLTVPYSDSASPGFVDGFGQQARVKSLSMYVLDENTSLWTRLPTTQVDTGAKTISVYLPHMSVFGAIAVQDLSVSQAYAYPVPFRPNGPDAGVGPGKTGTDAAGITFVNLPAQGEVLVYNVRGELMWRSNVTLSGTLNWDTRGSSGQALGSGVYLYMVRSPQEHKTGKLVIIR